MPVEKVSHPAPFIRLVLGILVVIAVLAWQVRRIGQADHPLLRAVEAVALAVPLFVVVFSLAYLSMSLATPSSFSEHLDRTSAVYYTVTVLTTVGFGDIVARSDTARIAVTIQMLLDLTLVAVIVKILFGRAQTTIGRRSSS